jgi:DNA-binding CsgD family transcriptional regulator
MPTIHDVARAAGVGIGTVSNVLNGRGTVGAAYRDRVEVAIAELGYVPNETARRLRAHSGAQDPVGQGRLLAEAPLDAEVRRAITAQDVRVLTLLADGADPATVAGAIGEGEQSVRRRLARLKERLGAVTTAHLVAIAVRQRII